MLMHAHDSKPPIFKLNHTAQPSTVLLQAMLISVNAAEFCGGSKLQSDGRFDPISALLPRVWGSSPSLGIALSQRTSAHCGGRRAGHLQHRPMERGHLVCSVVRLGHLCLRDPRAVQRQTCGLGLPNRPQHETAARRGCSSACRRCGSSARPSSRSCRRCRQSVSVIGRTCAG